MIENPENETTNLVNDTEIVKPQKRAAAKTLLANSDASAIVQAEFVIVKWTGDPRVIIGRCTVEEFTDWVNYFKTAGSSRHSVSGKRTNITLRLGEMDTLINKTLRYVKHYAEEEYGFEDVYSHYYKYGIVKVGAAYVLPLGRDERVVSIQKLIEHLTLTGYVTNKYGANYWQTLYDEYDSLLKASKEKEGTQSRTAGEKAEYREKIRLALRDVAKVLEILYPNNYISVQKEWGFLKSRN